MGSRYVKAGWVSEWPAWLVGGVGGRRRFVSWLRGGWGVSAVILRADAWVWEIRGGDGGHGGLQQKGFI
jgi:hypothetical protein